MPLEEIARVTCCRCKRRVDIPANTSPFLLYMYVKHGWTCYMHEWFCNECRPEKIAIDELHHPRYTNYRDYWDQRPINEWESHDFEDEPYDPYADVIQGDLCKICDYMHMGSEDDGSTWMMCCVENPEEFYGHNLYSGHFYGAAIRGRICPYFATHIFNNEWKGRDPIEDKKNGTFHVPYNELYDGD